MTILTKYLIECCCQEMEEYTQLRNLLLASEQERLEQLENRLDDPQQRIHDIAEILPSALRSSPNQTELVSALQAPVTHCVKQSIQHDPKSFAKAIMPVMVPALRKTLADAFKSIREFLHEQQTDIVHLTNRISQLEQGQITDLLNRLSYIEQAVAYVNDLEQRINELEHSNLEQLRTQMGQVDNYVKQLEQERINKLEQNVIHLTASFQDEEQRINQLVQFLPKAIRQATTPTEIVAEVQSVSQEELTESLQMPIEHCIKHSVAKDAHIFADILFPVMGPAIRKSINETFKSIVQTINTTLEQSLSLKGLSWRFKAWRTGQSFADIILQHTLVYRVEQVFLIHRETGLLIQHQSQDGTQVGDSEAISAMLTAIQDFIRDSFSESKTEELDSVEIGDYIVWLERGPYAILACVIRGVAPYRFKSTMRMNLESMHARYGKALQQFSGDSAPLEPCKPLLQQTLQSELKPEAQEVKNRLMSPLFMVIASILLLLLLGWTYWYFRLQQRLDEYVSVLQQTPGILLVAHHYQNGKLIVHGLRDPLAIDPQQIADKFGFTTDTINSHWTFYQDLHPQFVEQRLRQWLNPPKTVQMWVTDSVLYLRGHADPVWIDKVTHLATSLLGISRVDSNELSDNNAFFSRTKTEFERYLKTLQNTPGIAIISDDIEENKRIITGLRDPLAEDPLAIAQRLQLSDEVKNNLQMHWRSYQDLTPAFVEKRLKRRLNPPHTVQFQVKDDVLYLSGHASQAWITKAIVDIPTITGINQINRDYLLETDQFLLMQAQHELTPPPQIKLTVEQGVLKITGYGDSNTIEQLQHDLKNLTDFVKIDTQELIDSDWLIQQIEQMTIYFTQATEFKSGQESQLHKLHKYLQQLLTIPWDFRLQIIGNTDGVGTQSYNQDLSKQRATTIYRWLVSHGIADHYLVVAFPASIRFGKEVPNLAERKVTFQIIVTKTSENKDPK